MRDLLVGDTTYRLNRKVAEGGMGAVYEATQFGAEGFRKQVAIKTIVEKLASHSDFVTMFIGEAKLVADLVHENIVQVYQLDRTADTLYIVMEYIDGIDLARFMTLHVEQSRDVPIDLCAFIVSRICRGLDYAHTKLDREGALLGVVHRDVCPRNIMINHQGVVKLGDFGVAKAQNLLANREGSVLMGKAPYMSPEQAEYRDTDRRSDLFSLGVVFYQLLTGRSVFETSELTATLAKVVKADIPPVQSLNPSVPDALDAVLMKSLARRPQDRYQTAGEMGHALEHFMYHDRFGPTNVTLESYLRELVPVVPRMTGDGQDTSSAADGTAQSTQLSRTDAPTRMISDE